MQSTLIREQDPLKQGLKPEKTSGFLDRWHEIREQDPLKQGLKQTWRKNAEDDILIREQDPLKQGLKQKTVW